MKISGLKSFVCPMDQLPLELMGISSRCPKGHSFDFAREGYCNLLLVQQKASKDPGDNQEMMQARHRFLEAGFYAPMAEWLFAQVRELSADLERFSVVDAGCGEGYYLAQLAKWGEKDEGATELMLAGYDISKPAMKMAARRNKTISWAVASNRVLPFSGIDLLLSFFGFPIWESFSQAQKSGSYTLMLDAGPDHLLELRELIYEKVEKNSGPPSLQDAERAGYVLVKSEALKFCMELHSGQQIQDLLIMTPHGHRISPAAKEKLEKVKSLSLTADVLFRLLRKS